MTTVGIFLFSPLMNQLLQRIEAFLEASKMSATAFGKEAMGDPCLVRDLRKGRSVTIKTSDRIMAFIASREDAAGRVSAA